LLFFGVNKRSTPNEVVCPIITLVFLASRPRGLATTIFIDLFVRVPRP
jgi:hypothetical protein